MTVRIFQALSLSLLLVACAGPETPPAPASAQVPLEERIKHFEALHNAGRVPELRTHFAAGAQVQSPLNPRHRGVDEYLRTLEAEPYSLTFETTEVLRSAAGRAVTRSTVTANSPGRFSMHETVLIDWIFEDNDWRISRISFPQWPAVVGSWRRNGSGREGSLEWRILPDGTYLVFLGEDFAEPAFRGRYRLESNKIILTDMGASDPKLLQKGEGGYLFVRTPTGLTLRRVSDDNTWRSERFDGIWFAGK